MRYLEKFKFFKVNEIAEQSSKLVDKNASDRVRQSVMLIMSHFGFFADIFLQLRIMEASPGSGVNTMATDYKSIAYNVDFVKKLSTEELAFILLHELLHNANFHNARQGDRKVLVQIGNQVVTLWNVAADYAINLQIVQLEEETKWGTFSVPKENGQPTLLLDDRFKIKKDDGGYSIMAAEEIYDILLEEIKKDPNNKGQGQGDDGEGEGEGDGEGQPGQGQGQPGQGKPAGKLKGNPSMGMPDDIKAPGSLDDKGTPIKGYEGSSELEKADPGDVEKIWKENLTNAKAKNAGTGSKSMDRWFNKIDKPKVNWKRRLRQFVNKCFAKDPYYGYFSKRYMGQSSPEYLPGVKFPKSEGFRRIVLIIDTSGSIGSDTLAKFAGEIYGVLLSKKVIETIIIWCDDEIQGEPIRIPTVNIRSEKDFEKFLQNYVKPKGGGGTSFVPPFAWIERNLIKKGQMPSFVIYFTDAFGSAPNSKQFSIPLYNQKILWVITENDSASNLTFGEKIFLDQNPD